MSLQSDRWWLRVLPVYGWQSMTVQLRAMKSGVDVIVWTPGRVIDHLNRWTLKLDKIKYFVLDEADEMLNMWFIDDIKEILTKANSDRQTLLFSATMPQAILSIAKKYMRDYDLVSVKKNEVTTENVEQIYFQVREWDKFEALSRIIDIEDDFYGIVFCKTKIDTDRVADGLNRRWYEASAIHGDIQQKQREIILKRFKTKTSRILVATDVAARGIDVQDLTHVINFSLPNDPESYVHRIGRTGRAGAKWVAITFVTPSEYKRLAFFQRITKATITKKDLPDTDQLIDIKKKKLIWKLEKIMNEWNLDRYNDFADELLKTSDAKSLVAALLKYNHNKDLDVQSYKSINVASWSVSVDETGESNLFFALGKSKWYDSRKLVEHIKDVAWIEDKDISSVRILDEFSFVTVNFVAAEMIIRSFDKIKSGGRSVVSKAKERTGWWWARSWSRDNSRWWYRRDDRKSGDRGGFQRRSRNY